MAVGQKTKNSPHPEKGRRLSEKLRGTTQIAEMPPGRSCRFVRCNAALRPTCVAGSSGSAQNGTDRNALQLEALSLGGGWYISDPIIAICHNSAAAKGHNAPCVQLNYSMCKAFVNRFGQNLRDPDAVHMGYFTVLNRHGRISRIPSINIFFVPHGIANRPVSLCNHRVGFKICRTIR